LLKLIGHAHALFHKLLSEIFFMFGIFIPVHDYFVNRINLFSFFTLSLNYLRILLHKIRLLRFIIQVYALSYYFLFDFLIEILFNDYVLTDIILWCNIGITLLVQHLKLIYEILLWNLRLVIICIRSLKVYKF